MTNGAFHLNLEVGISSPTPTSKSSMTALCIIREICSNLLLISTSVLFVSHYTQ